MARRFLTALLLACMAVAGLAAPASAQRGGSAPTLLSDTRIDWIAGTSEWVNLSWTTSQQLDDVQVRVTRQSEGLTIEYPNGGDHSSLMIDSTLSANEVDFTALKVTTDASVPGNKRARIEISWDDDGRRRTANGWLRFTNRTYQGENFAILTETAAVTIDGTSPEANWVEFAYKGLAPRTTDMQITASAPFAVHHPQDTFTSLHHDQTLDSGETDVARVWFDPEVVELGSHTIAVSIDYTDTNGRAQVEEHQVTLDVVATVLDLPLDG